VLEEAAAVISICNLAARPGFTEDGSDAVNLDLDGSNTITCLRCGFQVRYAASNASLADVMAVHWFDHHGLIEWRDAAAEARYKLATTGHEDILDALVMALGDRRVAH
jgi:hypothetical protein